MDEQDKEAEAPRITFDLAKAVAQIEGGLVNTDKTTAYPVLLMLSGLPGVGKSYLARRLAEVVPFVIIESDLIRKTLFNPPTYSREESFWVHRVCHTLMRKLLAKGVRTIYDATNLIEHQRALVYNIAQKAGAKLVIVKVVAAPEVVWERLGWRSEGDNPEDVSDADWRIYKRMSRREEPIGRNFVVVDASGDIDEAVYKILRVMRK
ncbi:MAG: AAA family ATPase [Anaerolineae bacterium]